MELLPTSAPNPKVLGSSHFVGGVDANGMGAFAFEMTPLPYQHQHPLNTTLKAHKSWFYLGDGPGPPGAVKRPSRSPR